MYLKALGADPAVAGCRGLCSSFRRCIPAAVSRDLLDQGDMAVRSRRGSRRWPQCRDRPTLQPLQRGVIIPAAALPQLPVLGGDRRHTRYIDPDVGVGEGSVRRHGARGQQHAAGAAWEFGGRLAIGCGGGGLEGEGWLKVIVLL
jgi:hypothetical protein